MVKFEISRLEIRLVGQIEGRGGSGRVITHAPREQNHESRE